MVLMTTPLKSRAESLSLGQDAGKRSIVCSFRLSTCFTFDHSCSGASAYCHLLSCRPFQCDRLLCNWLIPTSCRSLLCSLRTLRQTSPGRTLLINTIAETGLLHFSPQQPSKFLHRQTFGGRPISPSIPCRLHRDLETPIQPICWKTKRRPVNGHLSQLIRNFPFGVILVTW